MNTAVPFALDGGEKEIFYLDEKTASCLTSEEVGYLTSKQVIAEAGALRELALAGYDLGGISVRPVVGDDAYFLTERFENHPISGGNVGKLWRSVYYTTLLLRLPQYIICGEDLEIFSEFKTASNDFYGHAGVIAKMPAGGKWAVFGNNLGCSILCTAKREQILDTAEYILGHKLPARLETAIPSVLLPRCGSDGKVRCVSILNRTPGSSGELKLHIEKPCGKQFVFMSQTVGETPVNPIAYDENGVTLTLPAIDGWSVGSVFSE